ncbi:MAG: hypothetical protein M3619_18100 [Myxococcota bacterium]|nr:hypothetical protein [Myxococcota bacterium]
MQREAIHHDGAVERAGELGRASTPVPHGLRERVGESIGRLWAPAIAAISHSRRARMFHPRGVVFGGRCEPIIGGAYANLGAQLAGRVLARFSGALWKRPLPFFDVLGIALRFRPGAGAVLDEHPVQGDQDLLFATIRSPLTMLASPFTTNARDFFRNKLWAVSPFAVHEHDRVQLRLVPVAPLSMRGSRDDRLREAVARGRARWHLEARRTRTRHWHAFATITFERELFVDQDALRFDAFRDGGGFTPVGLVHSIRKAAYSASQHARPVGNDVAT